MTQNVSPDNDSNTSVEVKPTPFSRPLQFLAFGFGSGLSPWAPGTAGTLVAVPLFLLVSHLSLPVYTMFVVITLFLGIWFCDAASRELGVHDHPGIVWDEFVGYWITMWALPADWTWIVAGFVVFRILDIAKPLTESVSVSDQFLKTSVFQRSFADAFVLDDFTDVTAITKSSTAAKSNAIGFSDTHNFATDKTFSDPINFAEQTVAAFEKSFLDSATITESIQISVSSLASSVLNASALNSAPLNN